MGLAFGIGYISYPLLHTGSTPATVSMQEGAALDPDTDAHMAVYWEAWRLLDRDFFGAKPPLTERTYGAIRGMVGTYNDPYTFFVEPQLRQLERDELRGSFGGIGATIEASPDGYLLRPVPDQPAARAGILDGDLLLLIDDLEVTPAVHLDDLVTRMRGLVNSEVSLLIRRIQSDGEAVELTFKVVRAEIETPSVEWRLLDTAGPGTRTGYIHQTIFSERSPAEMEHAIEQLLGLGANSFILDLRGNPGGLVSSAIAIADLWLAGGAVVIEQRVDGVENATYANPGSVVEDAPLVVLIDGGSASASEILAGALQDNARALLIGAKSFGKGSVQLIHELPDHSSLHITNAQWLTPNRHQISAQGLNPDIVIAEGEDPLPAAITAVQQAAIAKAQMTADK
jgi:carboxyl-terminal processing protease